MFLCGGVNLREVVRKNAIQLFEIVNEGLD